MSWRTRAPPSAGKVLTRFRKPREGFQPFRWFRPGLLVGEATTANSAVIGCHSVDVMDVRGQKRSWADVSGRPPTVLKTAGLASAIVRRRPHKMEIWNSESTDGR